MDKKKVFERISQLLNVCSYIAIGIGLLLIYKIDDKEISKQILVIGAIIVLSLAALSVYFESYSQECCPHGIYKGKSIQNGRCKCLKCQEEKETKQRIDEQNRKLKEQYEQQRKKAYENKRELLLSNVNTVKNLNPYEFEDFIAYLLRKLGFTDVYQTPYQNDGGKDIVCKYKGKTYYVECKHYREDNKISRPLLQKLFAAMTEDHINYGLFFTTSTFSSEAVEYGKRYHIRTIDGDELARIIIKNLQTDEMPKSYCLPCPICGSSVEFQYFDEVTQKSCPNNHIVNGVSEIRLFPKYSKGYSKKRRSTYFRRH